MQFLMSFYVRQWSAGGVMVFGSLLLMGMAGSDSLPLHQLTILGAIGLALFAGGAYLLHRTHRRRRYYLRPRRT